MGTWGDFFGRVIIKGGEKKFSRKKKWLWATLLKLNIVDIEGS